MHTLDAARRIRQLRSEVTSLIGPPLRRSTQASSSTPIMSRTAWDCGCAVGFFDSFFDGGKPVLRWETCGEHRRVAHQVQRA